MKYRIRMNANGHFVVERKRFWSWIPLGPPDNIKTPCFGNWYEGPLIFKSSEEACNALLKAQDKDIKEWREDQWTTVIEEEK